MIIANFTTNLTNDVRLEVIDSTKVIDSSLRPMIDELWERELLAARSENKILFNNLVYRFEHLGENDHDNIPTLCVSKISFKDRYIAKKFPDIGYKFGKPGAMFVHVITVTKDKKYVFGIKSGAYMTEHTHCFIGGVFDYGDTLVAHADKELGEELYVTSDHVSSLRVLGLYENVSGNVGVVMQVQCNLSSDEILHRFTVAKPDEPSELSTLEFVDMSKVGDYLATIFSDYPDVKTLIESQVH